MRRRRRCAPLRDKLGPTGFGRRDLPPPFAGATEMRRSLVPVAAFARRRGAAKPSCSSQASASSRDMPPLISTRSNGPPPTSASWSYHVPSLWPPTLPGFAIDELRRLKREQAESLLALGVRQDGNTLLCARADREPMQPRSPAHEFTRLVGRIKDLPRVRFHDLRHSHATQLLLAGVHPKIAQERSGHSTISVTLDLYSHVTATMQEDAAAKIDAAFRRAKVGSENAS